MKFYKDHEVERTDLYRVDITAFNKEFSVAVFYNNGKWDFVINCEREEIHNVEDFVSKEAAMDHAIKWLQNQSKKFQCVET